MIPFVFIPVIGILAMYILSIFETYELGPPLALKVLRFDSSMVHLGWTPRVFDDILDKRVIIKVWTERIKREYNVNADKVSAWIPFIPNAKNYVAIAFASSTHEGDYSDVLEFRAPDSVVISSLLPQNFEVHQVGNSSVLLRWRKPKNLVGNLKGYIIEYNLNIDGSREDTVFRSVRSEGDELYHKITGLNHGFHQFHLRTRHDFGASDMCTASILLTHHIPGPPQKPNFSWIIMETHRSELDFDEASCSSEIIVIDECGALKKKVVKITWLPNLNGNPGERFYVQYRPKDKKTFLSTAVEELETYTVVDFFNQHQVYEVFVTTLDGGFACNSDIQEVRIS